MFAPPWYGQGTPQMPGGGPGNNMMAPYPGGRPPMGPGGGMPGPGQGLPPQGGGGMVPPWMQGQFPGAGGFNPGNMGNFQPPTMPGGPQNNMGIAPGGSFPGGFNPVQGHIGGGGPSQTNPGLSHQLDPNRPMPPMGPGNTMSPMPTWEANGPGSNYDPGFAPGVGGGGGGMRPMPGGPSTAPGGGMGIPPQQPQGPQVQQQPGRPRWMDEQQLGSMMDVPWLKDIAMQQGPEMAQAQAQNYAQQNPNSPLGRYMAQQGANKPGMQGWGGPAQLGAIGNDGTGYGPKPGMSAGPGMPGGGNYGGLNGRNDPRMYYQGPAGPGGGMQSIMPINGRPQAPSMNLGQPGPGPQAPGMGPRGQQTGRPPQQQMPQGPGPRPMGPNTRPHTGVGGGQANDLPVLGGEMGPVQTPNEGRPAFSSPANTKPGMTQSPPFNPGGNLNKPKPGGTPPIYGGDKPAGGMTETAPVNPGGGNEMREMQKKLAMQRNQGMKTRAAQKR